MGEMPSILPTPPISSYAAAASHQQVLTKQESNVDLPPPSEMAPLIKTTPTLPCVLVVEDKEVGGMDGTDSEGFTEVATRKSKRGKTEGTQSPGEMNEEMEM